MMADSGSRIVPDGFRPKCPPPLTCGCAELAWSVLPVARCPRRRLPASQALGGFSRSSLYIQARGALKRELLEHLRRSRTMRRSRQHTLKTEDRTNIRDAISISERPGTAEDRAIPGHWEGDLLFGNANSQIATLVERQTRFVMLVKIAGKDYPVTSDYGPRSGGNTRLASIVQPDGSPVHPWYGASTFECSFLESVCGFG